MSEKPQVRHLEICEMEVVITCPKCGDQRSPYWHHGNGLELTHHYTCECGEEIEVLFQIGATIVTSSGTDEEAWL